MRAPLAAILALIAGPAFADAVTYRGDLNTLPVVLELSDLVGEATADSFGRYFYVDQGIDIPLHVESIDRATLVITEESMCEENETENTCPLDSNGAIVPPPPTATWTLEILDGGARLAGTWAAPGSKALPVHLELTGTRPFTPYDPAGPKDLPEFGISLLWGEGPLTRETSSYDYLKVTSPMEAIRETRWGDAAFRYFTDPRTQFQYPRITDTGSGSRSPANDFLEQRHWGMILDALNCRSRVYLGMNWGDYIDHAAGTLGGYDDEQVAVQYLTPRLMSYTESGSLFCGGAHPYNHRTFYNLDVETGERIDLSRIFKGWVARDFATGDAVDLDTARLDPKNYGWGPDAALADFVRSRMATDALEYADECAHNDLVNEYLAISFKHPDIVLFSLDNLPHVMGACADDLYEAPLAELKDLLTPEASRWFPELK